MPYSSLESQNLQFPVNAQKGKLLGGVEALVCNQCYHPWPSWKNLQEAWKFCWRNDEDCRATRDQRDQKDEGLWSKFSYLRHKTNIIDFIGKEITSEIVKRIHNCKAWALIADTKPNVSHHEQLSIWVRIVDRVGYCSGHLLCSQRAPGATAKGATFRKIDMSGCHNELQAIFRDKFASHVIYTHCYAHILNLVLLDSASTVIAVISLFSDLEKTYPLFSKSEKIHLMFESVQKVKKLMVLSFKHINTFCWNSREFSLRVFFSNMILLWKFFKTL